MGSIGIFDEHYPAEESRVEFATPPSNTPTNPDNVSDDPRMLSNIYDTTTGRELDGDELYLFFGEEPCTFCQADKDE